MGRGRIRKNISNFDYFKSWTPGSAYWLGFLFADGTVTLQKNKYSICCLSLKCTDEDHIQKYAEALESTHQIRCYPNNTSKFCTSKHYIQHEGFCEDLIALGCVQRKTKVLRWPAALPSALSSHFIRGYHDGDGCLTWSKPNGLSIISFTGTQSFLTSVQSAINRSVPDAAKGSLYKDYRLDCHYLRFVGRKSPMAVLNWVYRDSTEYIRLTRKYALYQQHKVASDIPSSKERTEFIQTYLDSEQWQDLNSCSKQECPRHASA